MHLHSVALAPALGQLSAVAELARASSRQPGMASEDKCRPAKLGADATGEDAAVLQSQLSTVPQAPAASTTETAPVSSPTPNPGSAPAIMPTDGAHTKVTSATTAHASQPSSEHAPPCHNPPDAPNANLTVGPSATAAQQPSPVAPPGASKAHSASAAAVPPRDADCAPGVSAGGATTEQEPPAGIPTSAHKKRSQPGAPTCGKHPEGTKPDAAAAGNTTNQQEQTMQEDAVEAPPPSLPLAMAAIASRSHWPFAIPSGQHMAPFAYPQGYEQVAESAGRFP